VLRKIVGLEEKVLRKIAGLEEKVLKKIVGLVEKEVKRKEENCIMSSFVNFIAPKAQLW